VADSETNNSIKRRHKTGIRAHFIVKEEKGGKRMEVGGINTIISQHIPHTIFPAPPKSFFYEKYYFIVLDGTSLSLYCVSSFATVVPHKTVFDYNFAVYFSVEVCHEKCIK
jgi:hypothetical protein